VDHLGLRLLAAARGPAGEDSRGLRLEGRADDFSIFTKRLINEMPVLSHLRRARASGTPTVLRRGPATAAHAPSVKSLGITSQLTGSRADVIIADDIEVPATPPRR
jgi:hypothetical protein